MPKQQRMMRIEPRGQLAAIQALESRSDEELEAETRYKAYAQLILGQRAAQRYDAKAARAYFQRALAAARPQERLHFRRTMDAALAYAERRADDYAKAAERLGVEAPQGRALWAFKFIGLIAPPASAGMLARIRGIVIVIALVIAILALAMGIVEVISLPFGGFDWQPALFYGFLLALIALVVAIVIGRRRQRAAQAKQAEQAAQVAARRR
jgi:hypothetical protein